MAGVISLAIAIGAIIKGVAENEGRGNFHTSFLITAGVIIILLIGFLILLWLIRREIDASKATKERRARERADRGRRRT